MQEVHHNEAAPVNLSAKPALESIQKDISVLEGEIPNIVLEEHEIATLNELIERYDRVIQDLDELNGQIENLLSEESIKGCQSPAF
jgi:tRNA(Ser,Leu) C12 N-acetylase TAN1